ncbi:hypothetical protein GGI21_001301, partial [Coemansia aciculifera]
KLQADFDAAAKQALVLKKKPTDGEMLELYGLFKQANEGEITDKTPVPGMLDFKGKAKFTAWKNNAGMSKTAAQTAYIAL